MIEVEDRLLVRNEIEASCRSCGEVHPFLSSGNTGADCATPLAVDPEDQDILDALNHFGGTERVGDREAVPFPEHQLGTDR